MQHSLEEKGNTFHRRLVEDDSKSVDSYSSEQRKGSRTLMCAVDGSVGSKCAFRAMMTMRKKLDHVCMFHTYSEEKDASGPSKFRNDEIREHYVRELTGTYRLPTTKFSFLWENRKGRTVSEVIGDMLKGYKGIRNPMSPTQQPPDIFICGFAGRRRSYDEGDSSMSEGAMSGMGKTADFAVRNLFMPTIVVKHTPVFDEDQRCIVVAVDGGAGSLKAFQLAMSLLAGHDKIRVVTVSSEHAEARPLEKPACDIREEYTELLAAGHVRDSSFETVACDEETNVAETLCEYAVLQQADFICLAPRAEQCLSSVTEYVLVHSHCSIILAKN